MKFERVCAGEYRAQLRPGVNVWVARKGHRRWVWFLGGYDAHQGIVWEGDDNGPFLTKKLAIADAIANYEDFMW